MLTITPASHGTRADFSLHPIDVGFDPRLHPAMVCEVPAGATSAIYSRGGETFVAHGTAEEILNVLQEAGYSAQISARTEADCG